MLKDRLRTGAIVGLIISVSLSNGCGGNLLTGDLTTTTRCTFDKNTRKDFSRKKSLNDGFLVKWGDEVTLTGRCIWRGGIRPPTEIPRYESILNYVVGNRDSIEMEAAQGKGPHLEALYQLVGCRQQDYEALDAFLQKNYKKLFIKKRGVSNLEESRSFLIGLQKQLDASSEIICPRMMEYSFTGEPPKPQ